MRTANRRLSLDAFHIGAGSLPAPACWEVPTRCGPRKNRFEQCAMPRVPSPEEASTLARTSQPTLVEQVMRKWYPRTIDRQRGGFHQNLARDWTLLPDQNCFLVYQARMTWTAAAFAQFSPADREEYVEYARHGVEFLDRVMRDREQGGFHWILDARGNPSSQLGTDKHVYGTAFVVYAGSRVYEVTRDPRALQLARDAFEWLETVRSRFAARGLLRRA